MEITDGFLGTALEGKGPPVQKQTRTGQQASFKALVTFRDYKWPCSSGRQCSKEVASLLHRAVTVASAPLSLCGEAKGGTRLTSPTLPLPGVGCCGSVLPSLGMVSTSAPKQLLLLAGVQGLPSLPEQLPQSSLCCRL